MVSVLVFESVDCGFIGGVMVNVLILKAVDRGFIGGVMVSVLHNLLLRDKNDNHYATNESTIYRFRDKHANPPSMNLRSNAFETSTLTVSVFFSKAVDHGFISGVMVSVLVFERVDCGFIGGVMVNVFILKAVDRGF
jgi:hypothetical protein